MGTSLYIHLLLNATSFEVEIENLNCVEPKACVPIEILRVLTWLILEDKLNFVNKK